MREWVERPSPPAGPPGPTHAGSPSGAPVGAARPIPGLSSFHDSERIAYAPDLARFF